MGNFGVIVATVWVSYGAQKVLLRRTGITADYFAVHFVCSIALPLLNPRVIPVWQLQIGMPDFCGWLTLVERGAAEACARQAAQVSASLITLTPVYVTV